MTMPVDDGVVGTTLGSFKITKVIGRGGMGTVYLGEHAVIGSRVAIKVLQERLAADEGLVGRFYAEARAVNLIGHENIVNIFDMNVVPPHRYYLVMEYLEGKPLNYLLTQPVPANVAIPILTQVCDALQAAHDAGIIHRDLKPENIFLVRRGKAENFVKVLDFGLAKLLDTERSSTKTAAGLIVGTPEFMSPEQANSTPVDGRSDVYSLGCIAWLLATGRLPYPQRGLTELLIQHRSHLPKPPHEVNPNVSRAWSDVIMKAVQKNPADRYQTAIAFQTALEQAMGAQPAAPILTPPSAPALPKIVAPGEPQPRHSAKFDAIVTRLDGKSLGTLKCDDISKGGMFLSTTVELPPVFARVKVTIPSANNLDLLAEVVRHVPADQARAWGMAPGFGVQFLDVTPQLRDTLTRLVQGLPIQPRPTASGVHSRSVEAALEKYRDRMQGDHYVILGLRSDASIDEIRARATEEETHLSELKRKTVKPEELAQLEAVLTRVRSARDTLGQAVNRARFDANRGNWRGIARCLVAGLGPLDLERMRQDFLNARPAAAGSAHVKFLASKGYEQKNQLKEALDACENALQLDPLNLQLHQRHAMLANRPRA
ncbi:MAG: serine/threonine protein kinase [Archangium gephyra]|uniref:Serine/threonine protein kinase n=1 Tax=Archangium gephyra TaxID=48 RepID=A0A2W5TMF3_9BACT|nr:MAG: serine/threonine protein kinase [Archangium gephyra]